MIQSLVKVPLDKFESCDKCSARARIGVSFLAGELYFCGHHAKELAPALYAQALKIYDPENYLANHSVDNRRDNN